MRPLTLSRLLFQCLVLTAILFVVVVVAMKFGAVPVSLYALGRDLVRFVLGQSSQVSTDYALSSGISAARAFSSASSLAHGSPLRALASKLCFAIRWLTPTCWE